MQITPFKRFQQLQPEGRVTLASLAKQNFSVRAMFQALGRFPSTISGELRRNTQPAGYASAQRRRKQSRPPIKLHQDVILFRLMRHFLGHRWSPE